MWGKEELQATAKRFFGLIADRWVSQFGKNAPKLPRWQRIFWCWTGTVPAIVVFLVLNEKVAASMQQRRSGGVEAVQHVIELWYTDTIFFVVATAVLSLIPAVAYGNSFKRGTPFALILISISSTAVLIWFLQLLLN